MTNTTTYLDPETAQVDAWLDAEYDRYEDEPSTTRRFRITIEGSISSLDDRGGYGLMFEQAASGTTKDDLKYDIESVLAEGTMWVTKVVSVEFLGQEVDEDDGPIITSTYDEPAPVVSGR